MMVVGDQINRPWVCNGSFSDIAVNPADRLDQCHAGSLGPVTELLP